MRVLRLPATDKYTLCRSGAEKMMDDLSALVTDNKKSAVVVATCFSGHLWLRISANAYSCRDDYVQLKEVLLSVLS